MSELKCTFCNTNFSSKYTLKNHQKTAKFCLEIQNKRAVTNYNCEYCNKIFNRKDTYTEHIQTCKNKEKFQYEIVLQENIKLQNEITVLRQELKNLQYINILYEESKEKVKKLEQRIDTLTIKAIENVGVKNTTINNRNQIYNSLQPLTTDYMKEQSKFLTYDNIKNGTHGIAHFASKHTFKDRIFCSDVSRLNFIFKNEEGTIIKDPEGVEVTKKFIEINKNELLRLLDEYFNYVLSQLERDDTDAIEYKHWADKREEIIAIRSAVKRGNMIDNKEYYSEFKKSFLSALSQLVAR